MARPPLCKLCDARHWVAELHRFAATPITNVTGDVTNVTGRGFGTGRGRRKLYDSPAARQAAYRRRRALR